MGAMIRGVSWGFLGHFLLLIGRSGTTVFGHAATLFGLLWTEHPTQLAAHPRLHKKMCRCRSVPNQVAGNEKVI